RSTSSAALGGWAEGYDVVGFDLERHEYGAHRYPGQLIIQDVLTLHGSQSRDAALIACIPATLTRRFYPAWANHVRRRLRRQRRQIALRLRYVSCATMRHTPDAIRARRKYRRARTKTVTGR